MTVSFEYDYNCDPPTHVRTTRHIHMKATAISSTRSPRQNKMPRLCWLPVYAESLGNPALNFTREQATGTPAKRSL
jgi:hypothetical protein